MGLYEVILCRSFICRWSLSVLLQLLLTRGRTTVSMGPEALEKRQNCADVGSRTLVPAVIKPLASELLIGYQHGTIKYLELKLCD